MTPSKKPNQDLYDIRGPYGYSGYWKTWSRVLYADDTKGVYAELNLTPVNPDVQGNWQQEVESGTIRVRSTIRRTSGAIRDRLEERLPEDIIDRMVVELGEDLTRLLLTVPTDELMKLVDLGNGYAPQYRIGRRRLEQIASD